MASATASSASSKLTLPIAVAVCVISTVFVLGIGSPSECWATVIFVSVFIKSHDTSPSSPSSPTVAIFMERTVSGIEKVHTFSSPSLKSPAFNISIPVSVFVMNTLELPQPSPYESLPSKRKFPPPRGPDFSI